MADVREQFRERKRRQWRVMWIGLPAILVWMAGAAVAFHFIVQAQPSWNSKWLMFALMTPGFLIFFVFASRFSTRNLRCPACDAVIPVRGSRYAARDFACPACNVQLG